jgi:opacity protein-like surface antigen
MQCSPALEKGDEKRPFGESVMRFRCVLLTVPVLAWTAAAAHAQWVITPQLGMNFAGDVEHGKGGPGGSVAYFHGRLGFELEFQRYQHFFKDSEIFPLDPAAPPNCRPGVGPPCTDIDTDAMGFMANVVVPIRIQGAPKTRPYGTAGLGLIRAWTNERERNQNDLGFNIGGGVMFSLSKRVGLRADLRYFRALADENEPDGVYFKDYGFWRATLGVTFGFPR